MPVSDVNETLSKLSPEKRELVMKALLAKAAASAQAEAVRPRSGGAPAPLSYSQQRLWFMAQLEPDNPFYNTPIVRRLRGRLDAEALERALNEIVRRHESLRTVFPTAGEQPVQTVLPSQPFALGRFDLQGLPAAEREPQARQLIVAEIRRPFDLARGPLVRGLLVQIRPDEHLLALALHHICTDGPSLTILFRELASLYAAFAAGQQSPLQPLPVQFADYALWQRERLAGTAFAEQLAYWRSRLAGLEPQMLPTDRPRPAVPTYNGAKQTFAIAPDLATKLKSLSQCEGATLFMTLLAAFQALLFRYTGQPDVAVNTAVATRPRPELEGLIGFFTNTLVIRTDLGGQPGFRTLLARAKEALLGALAHQDVPFEKLAEELKPERSLSSQPFTPISFAMNKVEQEISLAGLETRREVVDLGTTMNDLTLVVEELPESLVGTFQFNTDLFDHATVARMSTHLLTLLEAVAADPDVPVAKAPLLTEAERRLLLQDWNATDVPLPDRLVHQLIEEQAHRTPDAIAVESPVGQLTYRELNRRANQLAHWLRAAGVGPESLVALCMERTPEIVVGILGVLKAGGAYVPLDPAYPPERLAFMLADTQAPVILTQQHLLAELPEHGARTLCLDTDWAEVSRQSEADPAPHPALSEASPVYVFYTSGSTGKPKGVLVLHRGLLNHSQMMVRDYRLGPQDRVLQCGSISFDISVIDIFPTLECGATLVLPPFDRLPTVAEFRRVVEQERITRLNLPTAYWHEWAAEMARTAEAGGGSAPAVPASLRTVLAGGEAASAERLAQWRQVAGEAVEWVNIYGPTETTVHSTCFRAPPGAIPPQLPIGRPIANTRIYLLDEHRQPVPVGVPGEVYIGGAGVSRGYLGRPDLTEQRFLADPFHFGNPEAPARMYRTGDLARYLPDGNLQFLGRADNQVKVRGYRIELSEIEAVLGEHPAIHEAVVLPTTARDNLVAYFIPAALPAPSAEAVGAYLKQRLPAYMVPGYYMPVESWPMTPSGKVDRKALPPVEASQAGPAESFVAPQTQVEQVIASIWEELLHRDRIGLTDDFFDLGGHSLLATQMASRLREAFAVELPLKTLFQFPTLDTLARWVESAMQEARGVAVTPMLPADRSAPLPLSYAQQRLWFIDQLDPGSPAWNIPTPLRLEGALDVLALEAALGEIIRRHEALRTRFAVVAGQTVQVIDPPTPFVLPVLDLEPLGADAAQAEMRRLVAAEAGRPFDLARGPLMRTQLLRLSGEEHVLLLTLHHIVSDGWSEGLLTRELTALYAAFAAGAPSPLPELPVQYADFAAWQREWLQGDLLEAQLAYWKTQLAGIPAVLDLPTDRPRPKVLSHRGAFDQFRLSRPLTDALRALSRQEGATLFMTLLAAFQTLLHRYSRQSDICVGTPIAGRRRVEVEGLIGFFLNTLVLRADLSDRPTFRQLLRQVRETTLGAYAHQDIPFEMLIEALQPERSTSHSPFFQAVFALQNTPKSELRLPGLTLSPLEIERDTTKADLSLSLTETEDGLAAELGYNTDLFDRATALRIAAHFEALLTAVVADPDAPVTQVPFLPESERRLLLADWNATERPLPDRLVPQLIAARAAQAPDAIAVESSTGRLTYGELNRRANQLARCLRELGVGPERLVGLCIERSPEMLVGMLGIMKAGGAYVPLDPAYPADRLAFMLADTQAPVVLTQERLLSALPGHGARTLCLDTGWAEISRYSDADPTPAEPAATPDNTAYVIYTSGSTGRPKGVLVAHRGLLNHNMMAVREYGLVPSDRVLQCTSISFDISVEEIFPTLLSGGTLVLLPFERLPSIAEFRRMLEQEQLTVVNLPTAYWHEWVAETVRAAASVPETVRLVIVGGEKASAERLAQWRQIAGEGVEWLNTYGPTETTIICTFYRAQPGEVPAELPIGRPIDNTAIYLLDENRQPVPVGVPGELYVGGAGVANGYLNLPDPTAERFLPDPFAGGAPARMYRTGDLARWLADGNLQFLGRADNQVKIRGFRIEPSEVEAALGGHPAVREAIVLPTPDADSLVAYLIPAQQPGPAEEELRSYLKERLPAYMVPAFYMSVDAWPMTPSGKVDRKALPRVEGRAVHSAATFMAPGTRLEQVIAAVWQEVLHQDQISVHDNFFDLGGHSLLLIRVHSRLCEALQRDLSMIDLFRHPTVSSLARHLAGPAEETLDFSGSEERADSRREALKRQRENRLGRRGQLARVVAADEEAQDDF